MAVVAIRYAMHVTEGRAAGVEVTASDSDPLRIGQKFGPQAMKRRLTSMMRFVEKLMKIYVKLQFETGGLAYSQIAPQVGASGGSTEEWAPLTEGTLRARRDGHGYYKGLPGSGEQPRVWSGRGLIVAQQAIQASQNAVTINIRDAILALNERTRPLFVLEEVARLVRAAADRFFKALTGDKVHVFADDTFNLRVGEAKPFDFGDKIGRPKTSGTLKLLQQIAKGLR